MIRVSDMKEAARLTVEKLGTHEAKLRGLLFKGTVTFEGHTAFATWTNVSRTVYARINLPAMPDDAVLSRPEADRVTGYIVHEIGHAFHTDLAVFKSEAAKSSYRKQLLNGLEDPRIEDAVIQSGQAAGGRHSLTILVQSMLAALSPEFDAGDLKQAPFIIAVLGRAVRWGMPLPAGTFKIPRSLAPFYRIAMDGLRDAPLGPEGTAHLVPVVDRLMKWIEDNPQPQPQPQQGGTGDPVEGQLDDDAQASGGEPGDDGVEVEPDGSIERLSEKAGKGKAIRPMIDNLGKLVIERAPAGCPSSYDANISSAGAAVGQMSVKLARLLVSPERSGWTTQRPSGRFDPRRTTRAMAGSESVFKQRWEKPGLTTDVLLLVDQSSSMRGAEEKAAMRYLCVMAHALDRLQGVRFAAYGFASVNAEHHATYNGGVRDDLGSRHGVKVVSCVLRQMKSFDEPLSPTVKGRLAKPDSPGCTPDVPAIKECADLLRRRDSHRKVLMVLTDGHGDWGQLVTKQAVGYAVGCGVEVIGIGILNNVVGAYPTSIVVNDLNDLTGRSMDLLIQKFSAKHAE